MALIDTDYLRQLQALLPPGPAWPADDEATLTKLLAALSKELARVDGRAWQLIEEADPRTTAELFLDWDRVAGLPDFCVAGKTMVLGPGVYAGISSADIESFSRPSAATYEDINGLVQHSPIDSPRFSRDGLLIEAASSNLLAYSEQFDNAYWKKSGATVLPNAVVAPDGNVSAYKITNAAGTTSLLSGLIPVPASALNDYYASIFIKKGDVSSVSLNVYYVGDSEPYINFNLDTKVVTGLPYPSQYIFEELPDGWLRLGYRITNDLSGVKTSIRFRVWIRNYGSGVIGDYAYTWGWQLNPGSSPTSYIRSIAAPTVRAADFCSIYVKQTLQERRAALVGRLTTLGGQSPAYFIGLAAAIGYAVSITEFRAHTVNDDVEFPIFSEAWNFAWQVSAALNTVSQITVESTVEDPLAVWGNALLECVINRLKPAHTTAIFSYA